jgi:hypothetical protein
MITSVERRDAEAEHGQEALGRGGGVLQRFGAQALGLGEFPGVAGGQPASGQGQRRGG